MYWLLQHSTWVMNIYRFQREAYLITERHCQQIQQAVHHIKAGHTLFFTRDSVCVKGSKKEVTGNGTDIHHSNGY